MQSKNTCSLFLNLEKTSPVQTDTYILTASPYCKP